MIMRLRGRVDSCLYVRVRLAMLRAAGAAATAGACAAAAAAVCVPSKDGAAEPIIGTSIDDQIRMQMTC